tara:strand:+ start:1302 stop:1616 length:315 start_codon:yes stop_codon:yes gene_type:complete
MASKYELTKAWYKLTAVREINERINLNKGACLDDTVFSVLALIAHHEGITIQGIVKHPYFKNISLSTIKRAILTLIDESLIVSTSSEKDKRENLLSIHVKLSQK